MIVTKDIADRVKSTPMLSTVSARLLELLGEENYSINQVVKIVEVDASLTTKILRAANSVAYSPRVPISNITAAINNMGEKVIMGIAIEACSKTVFKKPLDGYDSPEGELWDHSLCTAIAARVLSPFAKKEISSNLAFTAGLLHDIGKSVISEFLAGSTQDMTTQFDNGDVENFLMAEQNIAGADHTILGHELSQHWKLPEPLAQVIRHHHNPSMADDEHKTLTYTVHLADILAMMAGKGTGADTLSYKIAEDYTDYFEIEEDQLSLMSLDILDEFIKTKAAILGTPAESDD